MTQAIPLSRVEREQFDAKPAGRTAAEYRNLSKDYVMHPTLGTPG
jgi:hypothetical protein